MCIAHMEELYTEAKAHFEAGDWENFLLTDETMHTYLGTMSGNPVFQFLQQSIHDNIHNYYDYYLPMNREWTQENLNDLEKIIAAIKAREADTASLLIQDHVNRFNQKMTKRTDGTSA